MKILSINESNYGSTGKIAQAIAKNCTCDYLMAVSNSRSNKKVKIDNCIFIGDRISRNLHLIMYKYTGLNGCFSIISTWLFIKKVKDYNPDIIHMHNLHNCYINLPMLFSYLKRSKCKVIWTLHDCWAFTGHCPHFISNSCDKWKDGCHDCDSYKGYPASEIDSSKLMWKLKKRWFEKCNITLVTPSCWLMNNVKNSFLKEYPCVVINNGIDTSVFKMTKSNFREKYGINKSDVMILGVAFDWNRKKGLDVFERLLSILEPRFKIVLVGTTEENDKELPKQIISIHKTANIEEMVQIYSAADIFVNPTREDTFPTVNMEAVCCETKVICFDVGGCKETLNENVGECIPVDRIDLLVDAIYRWEKKTIPKEHYIKYRSTHDINLCFEKYRKIIKDEEK